MGSSTEHIIKSYTDLHVELEPVIAQWRQLGEQLDVPDHNLRTIQAHGGDDLENCITEVLTRWSEQKPHTWEILIDAIAATNRNVELVEKLRRKYHDKMDSIARLRDTSNDVVPSMAHHWFELGQALGIDLAQLNIIDHQYGSAGNLQERYRRLLCDWWEQTLEDDRTWECIVRALESNSMKQHQLANQIREK